MTPAAPGQPLTPGESAELSRLLRALGRSSRFRLFIAVCDPPSRARELGTLAAQRSPAPIQEIELDPPVEELLDAVQRAAPDPGIKFVYGLERWLYAEPGGRFLGLLNVRRDRIAATLSAPLVLWMPSAVYAALSQHPPDFVSIALVLRFPPPAPPADTEGLRAAVLALAERYQAQRRREADQPPLRDGIDPARLQRFVDRAREPFRCLVLGRAKAGKSLLLNALVGQRLLPEDVLQATSAPIEVARGAQAELHIEYAGLPAERVRDDLPGALRRAAQLAEEHRPLPIAQLNELLVATQGQVADDELRAGLKQWDNPYRLPEAEFEARVRGYLRRTDWRRIPLRIRLLDPAVPEGIDFIDTPGLYARGGLGALTWCWLRFAGAILLVVSPTDLAADSSRQILESALEERRREALFLVLTRAALAKPEQVERQLAEAQRLYPEVPPENILAVDSVLGLAEAELQAGRSILDLLQDERYLTEVSPLWVRARFDPGRGAEALTEVAGRARLRKALEPLQRQAPVLPLLDLVTQLKAAYAGRRALLRPAAEDLAALQAALPRLAALRARYDRSRLLEALRPLEARTRYRLEKAANGEAARKVLGEYATELQARVEVLYREFAREAAGLTQPPPPVPPLSAHFLTPDNVSVVPTVEWPYALLGSLVLFILMFPSSIAFRHLLTSAMWRRRFSASRLAQAHEEILTRISAAWDEAAAAAHAHLQARIDAVAQRGLAGWSHAQVAQAHQDAEEQGAEADRLWESLELA